MNQHALAMERLTKSKKILRIDAQFVRDRCTSQASICTVLLPENKKVSKHLKA